MSKDGEVKGFDALLDEIETMSKALPAADAGDADDKKIKDAAAEGDPDVDADGKNDVTGKPVGDAAASDPKPDDAKDCKDDKDDKDAKPMGKAFKVVGPNGEEFEAFDGGEMLKALGERVDAVGVLVAGTETKMAKALETAVALLKSQDALIKSQGDELKRLGAEIERVGNEGKGRKSVAADPVPLNKSLTVEQLPTGEVMAKCLAAQKAGRLTGLQVMTADASVRNNLPVPAEILAQINA